MRASREERCSGEWASGSGGPWGWGGWGRRGCLGWQPPRPLRTRTAFGVVCPLRSPSSLTPSRTSCPVIPDSLALIPRPSVQQFTVRADAAQRKGASSCGTFALSPSSRAGLKSFQPSSRHKPGNATRADCTTSTNADWALRVCSEGHATAATHAPFGPLGHAKRGSGASPLRGGGRGGGGAKGRGIVH